MTTFNENRLIVKRARVYVDHIRNPDKKSYAVDYFNYIKGLYGEPEVPSTLSYMAAQAVRLKLAEIFTVQLTPTSKELS